MVNYCCVQGCGRNSRVNKYLNYYSLPKKKTRQKLWLTAAGKEDLLTKDLKKLQRTLRFCSRHFEPSSIKNRHLTENAVPSKCLPGSLSEDDEDRKPVTHEGIICDNCSGKIIGFRYKCVTCDNYDLCQKCEMLESHSDHYMLRIPRSLKFEIAGNFIVKLREILKSDQTLQELVKHTDKASKSVKENIRNDDKAIELTENVKKTIQREVDRALKSVKMLKKNKENRKRHVTNTIDDSSSKKQRTNEEVVVQVQRIEGAENIEGEIAMELAPELVFANVNETELTQNIVMAEVCSTGPHPEDKDNFRTFYLKTGIDLSQIMIQVVPSSEEPS